MIRICFVLALCPTLAFSEKALFCTHSKVFKGVRIYDVVSATTETNSSLVCKNDMKIMEHKSANGDKISTAVSQQNNGHVYIVSNHEADRLVDLCMEHIPKDTRFENVRMDETSYQSSWWQWSVSYFTRLGYPVVVKSFIEDSYQKVDVVYKKEKEEMESLTHSMIFSDHNSKPSAKLLYDKIKKNLPSLSSLIIKPDRLMDDYITRVLLKELTGLDSVHLTEEQRIKEFFHIRNISEHPSDFMNTFLSPFFKIEKVEKTFTEMVYPAFQVFVYQDVASVVRSAASIATQSSHSYSSFLTNSVKWASVDSFLGWMNANSEAWFQTEKNIFQTELKKHRTPCDMEEKEEKEQTLTQVKTDMRKAVSQTVEKESYDLVKKALSQTMITLYSKISLLSMSSTVWGFLTRGIGYQTVDELIQESSDHALSGYKDYLETHSVQHTKPYLPESLLM